jgi:hypothetical protein
MRTAKPVFLVFLAVFLLLPLANGQSAQEPNPKEIMKEFFGSGRSNDELVEILKKGAKEPYKTWVIEKIMAQSPDPDRAGEVLAQKPAEPYAAQAWKIVEASGSLKILCYVLGSASEEYQDKAYAFISKRNLIIEEYAFYIMRGRVPKRFIRLIWDEFFKLNPSKEGVLFMAGNAKGDFQEMAILYLLTQKLTASELDSVFKLIAEIEERRAKEREEKLIEIMTQK